MTESRAANRIQKNSPAQIDSAQMKIKRRHIAMGVFLLLLLIGVGVYLYKLHDTEIHYETFEALVAANEEYEGVMSASDSLRVTHILLKDQSKPMLDSDFQFLLYLQDHPLKQTKGNFDRCKMEVFGPLAFANLTPNEKDQLFQVAFGDLKSKSKYVRGNALMVLHRQMDIAAIPQIIPLLKDNDPGVAKRAKSALVALGYKGQLN